jgi:hypothetical protein
MGLEGCVGVRQWWLRRMFQAEDRAGATMLLNKGLNEASKSVGGVHHGVGAQFSGLWEILKVSELKAVIQAET